MRYLSVVVAVLVAVFLAQAAVAAPQESRSVIGTVVSMAGDTVTVKVGGQDMAFTVDKATRVIGTGAGTAERRAEAEGKAGVPLSQLLKAGDGVDVYYTAKGAANYATVIRRGVSVPAAGSKPAEPGKSVIGQVADVTGSGFSITAEGKTYTFSIDSSTRVLGRGFGTLTREKKQAGEPTTLSDFLAKNDLVLVDYVEKGGALHATEVHMVQKVAK
jgi:ribosome maturation factor RimP